MDEIVLLQDLVAQYIKEKSLTTPTQKNYTRIADQFSRETGIVNLDSIDFEKLLAWRIDVIARSSSTTWNNYLRHLRALWNFAITRGYLHSDHNPFNDLHWGKAITKKPKVLSEREIRHVIAVITNDDSPYPPGWFWIMVIKFLYYSGLRRRQVVGLTVQRLQGLFIHPANQRSSTMHLVVQQFQWSLVIFTESQGIGIRLQQGFEDLFIAWR